MHEDMWDASVRPFVRGQALFQEGHTGPIWEVISGLVVLEQPGLDGPLPVMLAFPGDLIGVEVIYESCYAFSAAGLLDGHLRVHTAYSEEQRRATVRHGLCQQQRQASEMVRLQRGSVHERLAYFLTLLRNSGLLKEAGLQRKSLPAQKEIARIMGIAVETVCREMQVLAPAKTNRQEPVGNPWAGFGSGLTRSLAC